MANMMPTNRDRWSLIEDEFDNLFEGFFRPLRRGGEAAVPQNFIPPMDVYERQNEYLIRAEMPGIDKDKIDISLADGVLTISGESKGEHEEREGERVVRQERRWGKFVRSVRVGTQIDEKNVKATYKDGVLDVILPKAEAVKPKKISVA